MNEKVRREKDAATKQRFTWIKTMKSVSHEAEWKLEQNAWKVLITGLGKRATTRHNEVLPKDASQRALTEAGKSLPEKLKAEA